jgi:secreted PhoX family phosphatase
MATRSHTPSGGTDAAGLTMDRRSFLGRSAAVGGGLVASGPLFALATRTAYGSQPSSSAGYGPLVNKGDLWLPAEFNYQVISRQGQPMSDGRLTPGIFDGMAAYPGEAGTTILIRNHENRERAGEIKVVTGPGLEYDEAMFGGDTKLVVRREKAGEDPATGQQLYSYEVVRDFAILGGTSTNCAGGLRSPHQWLACEEVVKGPTGSSDGPPNPPNAPKKHGYLFEIDARADGPVPAIPITQIGRRKHEAALERAGVIYVTEDRSLEADPVLGTTGASFYRYTPTPRGGGVPLAETSGPLEALKIVGEFHANMDTGRALGVPYPVEWVPVPDPDHDDDTDGRRDRVPGFIPNRIQAQDNGAAYFDRQEGMWAGPGDQAKIYFDCTTGGAQDLGQVWEYDPARETITLIYESTNSAKLENPDNMVVVPQTQDVFLCEDGFALDFVRGVTQDGEIYDFAMASNNTTEFCGACFDPDGHTLYVNQQGARGTLPFGPANRAVTYAIYGPFANRAGPNNKNFGNGASQ